MFTADTTDFATDGYVRLEWDDTGVLVDFYSWRLYRRLAGDIVWEGPIYETTDNVASYTFDDYFANENVGVEWGLTQVTQVSSVQTEQPYTIISDTPASEDYWILHPTDETLNVRLYHVTEDTYHDEYEESMMLLIGRGRKKDQGTNFGVSGSLTADIRDQSGETAKEQKAKLEALKESQSDLYLRTPFGQVWNVTLGQLEFTRTAGVGLREFGSMTIPYDEVAA